MEIGAQRVWDLKQHLTFDLAPCSAAERDVIWSWGKEDGDAWEHAGLLLKEPTEQKIECYVGQKQWKDCLIRQELYYTSGNDNNSNKITLFLFGGLCQYFSRFLTDM